MAAIFDAVTSIASDTASPIGGNHTNVAGNIAYVFYGCRLDTGAVWQTGYACTYGGVAMTLLSDLHGDTWTQTAVFRLVGIPTGVSAVSFSWAAGNVSGNRLVVATYGKAAQVSPERTIFTAINPTASINVTDPLAGDLLIDFGWLSGDAGISGPAGATLRSSGGGTYLYDEAITVSGAQSQTLSGSERYCHTAFCIKPGAAGSQIIMVMAERWKGFLRDLRAGLVPPNILKQRYGDLVAI